MASWWENDPIADSAASAQAADWWSKDPAAKVAPELTPQQKAEAEVRREMTMSAEDYDKHIREKVRAGGVYRPQPTRANLTSDQLLDAIGLQDEIVGAGQFLRHLAMNPTKIDRASQAYSDAAERIRAERRVARADNGWIGTAGEIVTGLASGGPLNALRGQAVRTAAPIAQSFGSRVGRAAAYGGGFGAASGFAQGEGGLINRGLSAGAAGLTGAVVGPLISEVVLPVGGRVAGAIGDAARYSRNALASVRNPERAAVRNVADRLVASGVDPAQLRQAVSPAASANLQARGITEEQMAELISRGLRGEPAAQIAADFGMSPQTVTRYVNLYRTNNPTPMNIIDLTKETVGEGASGPVWRLGRAANSLAGDDAAEASQALISRQETQPGRVSGIARQAVGGRDYESTLTAGRQRLSQEANQAYRQFYDEPSLFINQLGDLMDDPLFRRANIAAQRQARIDVIAQNQRAARTGGTQQPVPTVDPGAEEFTPQMLDYIQRQLRIASEGFASNPTAARHARNLREVFLDRIEGHYPTFQPIRQAYAQAQGEFGEDGALLAGRELTNRLGERTDEALRDFNMMTPAQQELFRLGFARKIQDDAANTQAGAAAANKYNTGAFREIVSRIFRGDRDLQRQGEALVRNMRREAITTKTKNDVLAGARTAELESDMGRQMETAKTAANALTGRFMQVLNDLSTRLTTQLGRRGATEVNRILTMTEPDQMLPMLNRLARAAATTRERNEYVVAIRALRRLNSDAASAGVGINAGRQTAPESEQRR